MGGRGPLVLSVSSTVPVNNARELVAYVKAHPSTVSYASFGAGTSSHIYGEAFVQQHWLVGLASGHDAVQETVERLVRATVSHGVAVVVR